MKQLRYYHSISKIVMFLLFVVSKCSNYVLQCDPDFLFLHFVLSKRSHCTDKMFNKLKCSNNLLSLFFVRNLIDFVKITLSNKMDQYHNST